MTHITIIGNAAGSKSTLASKISAARGLPRIEVDKLLWEQGWKLAPSDDFTVPISSTRRKNAAEYHAQCELPRARHTLIVKRHEAGPV